MHAIVDSIRAVAIAVSLSWSMALLAQTGDDDPEGGVAREGYVLKSGEGEDTVGDASSIIKASPKTGTQGVVFVDDKMPPAGTSGIHKHLVADEFFYVIKGSGRILLGEDEHPIESGDFAFVPRDTYHKITSSDDDPLHVIFVVDRAGLDEQFRLELRGLDRNRMTVEEFNKVVRQYGTVYKTFE